MIAMLFLAWMCAADSVDDCIAQCKATSAPPPSGEGTRWSLPRVGTIEQRLGDCQVYTSGLTGKASSNWAAVKAHILVQGSSLHVQINKGDKDPFNKGLFTRTEIVPPVAVVPKQKTEVEYHVSTTDIAQRVCFHQWMSYPKANGGGASPLFQLGLRDRKLQVRGWILTNFKGLGTWKPILPWPEVGNFSVTIQWSTDKGSVQVRLHGKPIFDYKGRTLDRTDKAIKIQGGVYQDLASSMDIHQWDIQTI